MKKLFLCLSLACLSLGAQAQIELKSAEKTTKDIKPELYKFTDVDRLETTPVKDQHRSGTCWSYSGVGTIENDLLTQTGKVYDLSEMWVVRNMYMMKAEKFVRMHGEGNFSEGGVCADVQTAIKKFGIMPESASPGIMYGEKKHTHSEISKALTNYIKVIVSNPNRKLSSAWKEGFNAILDVYFGVRPEKFTFEGKEYTPMTFLTMTGLNIDDYVTVTSFTHHDLYSKFIVEIPDNWNWNKAYNVTLDEMTDAIDTAFANKYAIGWDADVSESGFRYSKGIALMPVIVGDNGDKLPKEMTINADVRQKAFDNYMTTDDHLMVLVGTAKDQEGNPFYIVKNSWDSDNVYGGYVYASRAFIQSKTISIFVNKNALTQNLKTKLNIK